MTDERTPRDKRVRPKNGMSPNGNPRPEDTPRLKACGPREMRKRMHNRSGAPTMRLKPRPVLTPIPAQSNSNAPFPSNGRRRIDHK